MRPHKICVNTPGSRHGVLIVLIVMPRCEQPSNRRLWWRDQMETFSALLAICAGNSPVPKASDAELWCFSLICTWINGRVNNREAGDLRRYRAHYDVIVMRLMTRWSILTHLVHGAIVCWCELGDIEWTLIYGFVGVFFVHICIYCYVSFCI